MPTHARRLHAAARRTLGAVRRRVQLVGIVFVGTVLLSAGCASGQTSALTTTASSTPTAPEGGTSGKAEIVIANFMFVPATLTVKPGTAVTVVNHDNVAHTVTSSSGGFDTGDIPAGGSAVVTAPSHVGAFTYICGIHQYMTGELVVS